jgi:kinesin family protein 11
LSLSCLGNTINALLKRNDHIPYRESKLTRLLYESLGGNSLTRLIVTCSGEDSEIEETLSSLKFAARAKNLKTNPLINTLRKS